MRWLAAIAATFSAILGAGLAAWIWHDIPRDPLFELTLFLVNVATCAINLRNAYRSWFVIVAEAILRRRH